jgi:hypothetical protein
MRGYGRLEKTLQKAALLHVLMSHHKHCPVGHRCLAALGLVKDPDYQGNDQG